MPSLNNLLDFDRLTHSTQMFPKKGADCVRNTVKMCQFICLLTFAPLLTLYVLYESTYGVNRFMRLRSDEIDRADSWCSHALFAQVMPYPGEKRLAELRISGPDYRP
jgi:hypothetical protein